MEAARDIEGDRILKEQEELFLREQKAAIKDRNIIDAVDIVNHVQHQLNFVSCNTEDSSLGFIIIGISEYLKKAQNALDEALGGTDGDDK